MSNGHAERLVFLGTPKLDMTLLPAAIASALQHDWTSETLVRIAVVPQPVVGRELRFQGKTLVQMHTMFAHGPGISVG